MFGHDDHVLDANAAKIPAVEAWFDGEGFAGKEGGAFDVQQGWFVDIESDAVAGSVRQGAVGKRGVRGGQAEAVASSSIA